MTDQLFASSAEQITTITVDGATHVSSAPLAIDRQGFRIGQLNLLVKFEDASELIELPTLYRIPGTPRAIRGICNLHGNVVPVFSLYEKLAQPESAVKEQKLLVLGHGDRRAGVLIDGLPLRKKFLSDQFIDPNESASALQGYAHAAWRDGGTEWFDLDYTKLLDELGSELRA